MGLDDEGKDIVFINVLVLVKMIVVLRLEGDIAYELVKGDVGRVADFLVAGYAVGIELRAGFHLAVHMIAEAASGQADSLVFNRTGQVGEGVPGGVAVVKEVGDHAVDRGVRLLHLRALEQLVKADVVEELAKALDAVNILQTVEVVQHHAQLIVAVLRQGLAALAGGHVVVDIGASFRVAGQEHVFAVEVEVAKHRIGHKDVGERRHRDQVQPVLMNQVDIVGREVEPERVAVAVEGAGVDLLQQRGLARLIEGGHRHGIQRRSGCGAQREEVIVHELDVVLVKVEGHGGEVVVGLRICVVAGGGHDGALRFQLKADGGVRCLIEAAE